MSKVSLTNTYKKYQKYKDSGIDWVGEVPADWDATRAKNVFKKNNRPVRESDEVVTAFRDGMVTLRKNRREDGFTFAQQEIGYQGVRKGDLVIHGMDAFAGAIGVSDSDGKSSPVYSVCTPRIDADPKFHMYLLRHMSRSGYLTAIARGIRERSTEFKWPQYGNLFVINPPREEQEKIAKFLDEQTARIDETIAKKQKLIELLKEEIVSIAQKEQKEGKGKTIRIRDSVKLAEGPIELEDNSEYVALGLYNRGRGLFVKEPQLGIDIKESDFYKVIPRDLIISGQFAWEGAVALASEDESNCVVSHRYYLLRDGVVKTEYLLALLMTKFGDHILNESSRGSAGRNRPLNIKMLLKEKIRVPSKEAETKIESLLIKMSLGRENIKKSIKLLEEYRSSLISHAVTGKIKV